jgi:hypothetical protein
MSATVSTIPAVLDALVQRWTLALPDAQVSDGQPHDHADDMVLVGFTGTPGEEAVTSEITVEQMAAAPNREQYTIACIASSWKGADEDVPTVRGAAFGLLDAIAADLAEDPRLGGLVMSTRLTVAGFTQYQTMPHNEDSAGGTSADIRFTVTVSAFTRRP